MGHGWLHVFFTLAVTVSLAAPTTSCSFGSASLAKPPNYHGTGGLLLPGLQPYISRLPPPLRWVLGGWLSARTCCQDDAPELQKSLRNSEPHAASTGFEDRPGLGAQQPQQEPRPAPTELDPAGDAGGGACYDAHSDGLAGPHIAERLNPASTPTASASGFTEGVDRRSACSGGGEGGAASSSSGASNASRHVPDGLRSPVIYLPPLTGSELNARLVNKPSAPHWWCPRHSPGWFKLWPVLESLLPWHFPCYADNLRLVPDPSRGGAGVPPPGVEVRLGATLEPPHGQPGGGGGAAAAFSPWSVIAGRLRQMGWSNGELDTHAYDWRKSPPSWLQPGGSFAQLRALIEAKVAASGGRRVVLLGLSLGGSYGAAFLATGAVSEEWKARHVERLVTISGVWGGTPRSPWDLLSGRLEGLEAVLDRAAVRALVRGLPSLAWTFPAPQLFGGAGAEPVVENAATGRSYGPEELGQALRDAGAADAAAFWESSLPFMSVQPPNVSTHCFYSYGLPSALRVTYAAADFSDANPAVQYGDGDVTVPYASLAACRGWAAGQVAPVRSASYYGVVHAQLTGVPEALQDIVEAVAGLAG